MKSKKVKIRTRLLKAFTAVLFFSFLLVGIIFNITIRIFAPNGQSAYIDASGITGRAGWILVVLVSVMFLVAVVVTYLLSNSLTRPIEKLGQFAQGIGHGDFTPNDFQFREVELEELNMALNKSVKQLGEYDINQKVFFQNASHELRTPLMSIQCYAEGISFGIMEPKSASETILQETHNLADLVTDLLYVSKIDSITTAYRTEQTDLIALIQDSITRQETMAAKRQIEFTFNFDTPHIYYKCTSELFSRALDNLISNAVRYASSEILLSCTQKADHIEICVSDDGPGIASDLLPHIFERFIKGPDGNHGIGLSIVKTIVEQRGGQITANNREGGGAMFHIILPNTSH